MDLKPYQQTLYDKILAGGFKHGELSIISAGRGTGKSTLNQYLHQWTQWLPEDTFKYKVSDNATVDGRPWYTVRCNKDVAAWIRQQPGENKEWYQHIDDRWVVHGQMFDISEELYMMLVLKFGR